MHCIWICQFCIAFFLNAPVKFFPFMAQSTAFHLFVNWLKWTSFFRGCVPISKNGGLTFAKTAFDVEYSQFSKCTSAFTKRVFPFI